MVVGQPFEEGLDLAQVVGGEVGRGRLEVGDYGRHVATHRQPVLDRAAHVAENSLEVPLESFEHGRIALPVDLDVHEAFGPGIGRRIAAAADGGQPAVGIAVGREDRMDREVDADAVAVDLHGHAVDQERHVVVDDLDHGVGRLPAMLLQMRVVDAHLGGARWAGFGEAEMGDGGAVEVEHLAGRDVARCHVTEVAAREERGQLVFIGIEPGFDLADDGLDQLTFLLFCAPSHRSLPLMPRHPTTGEAR